MSIKICYEDESDLATFEAYNKGYRNDVIVYIEGKKYRLYVTAMLRLQQDFETEFQASGFYLPEHNLVIVKEVTNKEIEKTINFLCESGYFSKLSEDK